MHICVMNLITKTSHVYMCIQLYIYTVILYSYLYIYICVCAYVIIYLHCIYVKFMQLCWCDIGIGKYIYYSSPQPPHLQSSDYWVKCMYYEKLQRWKIPALLQTIQCNIPTNHLSHFHFSIQAFIYSSYASKSQTLHHTFLLNIVTVCLHPLCHI